MIRMRLVSNFWYLDPSAADGTLTADKENKVNATRLNYFSRSQTVELYGRLHADFFNSDRMLINGEDTNISLTRAPEAFYLLGPADDLKSTHENIGRYSFYHSDRVEAPSSFSSRKCFGYET